MIYVVMAGCHYYPSPSDVKKAFKSYSDAEEFVGELESLKGIGGKKMYDYVEILQVELE